MNKATRLHDPRGIRHKLGMNQQEFWGLIGVTQSGGSRYESGRAMPKPVLQLLRLVHVERIDIARVTRGDFEILSYLKTEDPGLYRRLKTEATASRAPVRRQTERRAA